jgi:hypothetical protein
MHKPVPYLLIHVPETLQTEAALDNTLRTIFIYMFLEQWFWYAITTARAICRFETAAIVMLLKQSYRQSGVKLDCVQL